jgi:CDP-diacylglycerol--glycerol-3-phosphate 3-phosphatidyltransferase
MERAERMVLLGIGLAFDILVPVLWLMIALTALTAIQRFIKVWRQASDLPARPRLFASRHRRVSGTAPDGTDRVSMLARWREQRPNAARRDAAREARRQARATRRNRP